MLLFSGGLSSQTLLYSVPADAPEPLGPGVAALSDIDGDGRPDFAVSRITLSSLGGYAVLVRVLSGRTGQPILADVVIPVPGPIAPPRLANVGDVDGDGFEDLAVGAVSSPAATVSNVGPGFSPAGGPPLLTAQPPLLGTTFSISLSLSPPSSSGLLVLAPGIENPATLAPGMTVYPGLLQISAWTTVPMTTTPGGNWSISAALPLSFPLAGTVLTAQAWLQGGW